MIPVTPCGHDSNHNPILCLYISVTLFYGCMADVLMTALDFEHSSLDKRASHKRLKIGWQAKACVAIARPEMCGRCP